MHTKPQMSHKCTGICSVFVHGYTRCIPHAYIQADAFVDVYLWSVQAWADPSSPAPSCFKLADIKHPEYLEFMDISAIPWCEGEKWKEIKTTTTAKTEGYYGYKWVYPKDLLAEFPHLKQAEQSIAEGVGNASWPAWMADGSGGAGTGGNDTFGEEGSQGSGDGSASDGGASDGGASADGSAGGSDNGSSDAWGSGSWGSGEGVSDAMPVPIGWLDVMRTKLQIGGDMVSVEDVFGKETSFTSLLGRFLQVSRYSGRDRAG